MADAARTVTVTRTGGVAGVARAWTAEIVGDVEEALAAWRPPDATGVSPLRDAFEWSVSVDGRAVARVSESALDAAARQLIDAVRAAASD